MGYACPVCGDPQADPPHLANHLAFTALIRGGDHEAWLDEHVPDWEDLGEAALAERVTDHAEETEYPQVFEDTTDQGRDHDHDHAHDDTAHTHRGTRSQTGEGHPLFDAADGAFSDDAGDVLAEARELTRKRHGDDAADSGTTDDTGDGDANVEDGSSASDSETE